MELNKNCIEILQYLRKKQGFVKIGELAKEYKLTDRAIRYRIDKIESFLVKNGFQYLEKQHLKGVRLVDEPKLQKFLDDFIGNYTPYRYVYSKDERFKFIILKLLEDNNPMNISYFEKKLCISRNTVLKELDKVEKWLNERNIKMLRKPRVGINVNGKEVDKRKAILETMSKSVSTEDIVNYVNRRICQSKINNLQFDILFSDIDIDFIDKIIKNSEIKLERQFSDEAYGSLVTHVALMIKRIQLNKSIYLPELKINYMNCKEEYKVANNIIYEVENHYNIKIPIEEKSYIVLHLLGAKVIKNDTVYQNKDEYKIDDLYVVVNNMTDDFEKIYAVELGKNRGKVVDGLLMHLRPSIYRIKFNLKLVNPFLREIKVKYKELFINTKIIMKHLENYIGKPIDDNEVAYVVLHYGAALKNCEKKKNFKARIVLVCGTGIGTARMVASQIVNEFDVKIVNIVSSREVKKLDSKDYDFIISTVYIANVDEKKYIKISPLFLKNDYKKLKSNLNLKYKRNSNDDEVKFVKKIMNIVDKYSDIKDRNQLEYEIMYAVKNKNYNEGRVEVFQYGLKDLLKWENIKLNVKCRKWKEAIKIGTSILIENNSISKSYEEAIIKSFKDLGPYMVVAPGIVLSHAKPSDGVNNTSMSLITLDKPVKFNHKLNDPVKLIVTLATKDEKSHLKAMRELMELFMNSEDLKEIFNAINKEKVIEIINKY